MRFVPTLTRPWEHPNTAAWCFLFWGDELRAATSDPFLWLCVFFLAYSCYLWIGLGPGAIWMGIALRLTAIHVLLLYKKVNFRAVCPGDCLKRQRPRQKWIGLQDGLQPRWDRQWLGRKWMRWLTVSHIFSNAPSCLCANIIPPRIERPLVTRVSLLYRSPLLFPSRKRMRRSWLVSIFWLLAFLLH